MGPVTRKERKRKIFIELFNNTFIFVINVQIYTNKTIIPPKNNSIKMKEIHFDEIVDNKSLIMRVIKINIILANKGVLINIKKKKKYLCVDTTAIIYII